MAIRAPDGANKKDCRQQSDNRTVSGSSLACPHLHCPDIYFKGSNRLENVPFLWTLCVPHYWQEHGVRLMKFITVDFFEIGSR